MVVVPWRVWWWSSYLARRRGAAPPLARSSTHPDPKKRVQSAESLVMNCAWVLSELQIPLPEAAVRMDSVRRSLEEGKAGGNLLPGFSSAINMKEVTLAMYVTRLSQTIMLG